MVTNSKMHTTRGSVRRDRASLKGRFISSTVGMSLKYLLAMQESCQVNREKKAGLKILSDEFLISTK